MGFAVDWQVSDSYSLVLGGFFSVFPATLLCLPRLWTEMAEVAVVPLLVLQLGLLIIGAPVAFFLLKLPSLGCPLY